MSFKEDIIFRIYLLPRNYVTNFDKSYRFPDDGNIIEVVIFLHQNGKVIWSVS